MWNALFQFFPLPTFLHQPSWHFQLSTDKQINLPLPKLRWHPNTLFQNKTLNNFTFFLQILSMTLMNTFSLPTFITPKILLLNLSTKVLKTMDGFFLFYFLVFFVNFILISNEMKRNKRGAGGSVVPFIHSLNLFCISFQLAWIENGNARRKSKSVLGKVVLSCESLLNTN